MAAYNSDAVFIFFTSAYNVHWFFGFFLLGPPLFNVTSVTPPETLGKSNIFNPFLQYIFINLNRVAYG